MKGRNGITAILLCLAITPAVLAQSSASYILDEHVVNAGGRPAGGEIATSSSYRVTLDALGESLLKTGLSSASFRMDGGFGTAYPPPGEVNNLFFDDKDTLAWNGERSVGVYNLYRDLMSKLPGLGYGDCHEHDITGQSTKDFETPTFPGDGFFYLVTAENRLDEEGTKGYDGDGSERGNPTPCP